MCQIIYRPDYKKYNLGEGHPFDPVRIEMVVDLLTELKYWKDPLKPETVSPEKLYSIHDKEYVDTIEALSRGENESESEKYGLGTLDNPIFPGMAEGARIQAGGTLLGATLLIENKTKKVLQLGGGFHHAHWNMAAGFCIYNDIALAIKEMTEAGWHVLYLDIDVHHGDGVQEIFYADDKVMTISIHESGEYLFPGTGWIHELGQGMGRSLKLNLPLEPYTEGDSFMEVLEGILDPAIKWFRPDALVVQAGADAHFSDPLADLMLTVKDFKVIITKIIELSNLFAKERILFTLGGGYSITSTLRIWAILYMLLFKLEIPDELPEFWLSKWEKKLGKKLPVKFFDPNPAFDSISRKNEIAKHNRDLIRRVLDAVTPDWL